METLYYSRMDSPVGKLLLGVSSRGLACLEFDRRDFPPRSLRRKTQWVESEAETRPYARELQEYFAGQRREFSFALDLRGTDFQKRCWQELLRIPYGKTKSYAEIARAVGRPAAFRAVGQANHRNPVAIVVPCHRVITADGRLGGYGGGLEVKRHLLRLEGVQGEFEF
ncbi:MAG TPA: methylated-DNA--[protein]-cysteine S-methyltransferase [Terriglobales bacterium]|nr:methylated-DNA--[protein]-cysteine S-methyltransferase [Terriglobales bacterium]